MEHPRWVRAVAAVMQAINSNIIVPYQQEHVINLFGPEPEPGEKLEVMREIEKPVSVSGALVPSIVNKTNLH